MITEIITFWGIVQGVGFRPTLSRIAEKYRMKGQVRNMGAFVQLIVTDEPARIDEFVDAICAGKPRMADIIRIDREVIDTVRFASFRIAESVTAEDKIAAVPADIAVCENCLSEFYDERSPRYMHPFISCVDCGPRYTIMERLPYDRDTTTMDDFPMCDFCAGEYKNPATRRYHAQTVSCHNCGPQPTWLSHQECAKSTSATGDGSVLRSATTRKEAQQGTVLCCASDWLNAAVVAERNTEPSPVAPEPSPVAPCAACCAATHGAAIEQAIEKIRASEVIALKGVGGYYFVCDPFSESAVRRLRDIKVREYKPFAIMFSNTAQVREYCEVSAREEELLTSPKRPIVLLERREKSATGDGSVLRSATTRKQYPATTAAFNQSGAQHRTVPCCALGAFLPSMALQYMILSETGPLVMTSANISDLPIIKDDDVMLDICGNDSRIAGVLFNERRIVRRLDDSVTRVIDDNPQLIRRSKGYTPVPIYTQGMDRLDANDMIFASGGHLKCAFALTKGSLVYMSRYIGDIDNIETEQDYEETLASMSAFFAVKPGIIAHDMHPLYWTTEFAAKYAQQISRTKANVDGMVADSFATDGSLFSSAENIGGRFSLPQSYTANDNHITLLPVQHHHAHIASVMAEHGLKGQVIGVAFDGTGYGTDGTVWGGEILICEGAEFTRFSHLRTITTTGGDPSMRDGWKSAVSRLYDSRCRQAAEGASFDIDISHIIRYAEENDTLAEYSSESQIIEVAIAAGQNTIITSSMGRLFDAVASLLGIHHVNRYEGECAILLENAAARGATGDGSSATGDGSVLRSAATRKQYPATTAAFNQSEAQHRTVPCCAAEPSPVALPNHPEADALALRFHLDVAKAILAECRAVREACGTNTVCLSGGVFQNKILMEETLRLLRADGFSSYYNITVPTGDGGIALGQAYIAMQSFHKK